MTVVADPHVGRHVRGTCHARWGLNGCGAAFVYGEQKRDIMYRGALACMQGGGGTGAAWS